MREIKFRAYDKASKKVLEVIEIDFQGMELLVIDHDEMEAREAVYGHYELLQFTGLLDKNGTEIYEGDYVKCKWGHSDWNGTVEFIEGSFCSNPENPEKYPSAISECNNVEVIGNIYEHPHLLSGDSP